MRRQQELHDAQTRFRSHGGKHIRVSRDLAGVRLGGGVLHISIIAEIWNDVKGQKNFPIS